jgi:hypothetical protein
LKYLIALENGKDENKRNFYHCASSKEARAHGLGQGNILTILAPRQDG